MDTSFAHAEAVCWIQHIGFPMSYKELGPILLTWIICNTSMDK